MKLKKIYIEITNNCNLNCDFCIKNKRDTKYMDIKEFELILKKIKPYTKYIYLHVLGEPLMHPDINEFINVASNMGFYINLTTNGYLIDKIKNNKNIRQINISLHSFINNNVTLDNYLNNIFSVIETLKQNNTYISLRLWVKNKYTKPILDYINKKYDTNIIDITKNILLEQNVYINPFHEFIWPDLNNDYYNDSGTCYALKDHIAILVDGTIVPCCLDTEGIINLGNIKTDSIDNIFTKEIVKDMLNNFKNNKKCEELCKHCKFIEN